MRGVQSTPSPASPASRPAPCGWTSPPPRRPTDWLRSPGPRPTSASPATRWAAASPGWPARTASPPTASSPSRWSPPTACMRRVDETHEPELFWALRGGGGSFGVVTAIEFRLYPITEVYAGVLFFPSTAPARCSRPGGSGCRRCPTRVTSVGRILRFPPIPDLPPHLSGQSYVVVEAACQLPADEAGELLAPLRALGPAIDTFDTIPITGLSQLHMDPPGPVPGKGDGALLGELTAEAIESFARVGTATRLAAAVARAASPRRRADPGTDVGRCRLRHRRRVRDVRGRGHSRPRGRRRPSSPRWSACSTSWVRGRPAGCT